MSGKPLLKKDPKTLIMLNTLFATAVVMANVTAAKIIQVGWFVTTSGMFAYAATFLITDIIDEIWGKKEAHRAIWYGFWAQILALIISGTALALPVAPFAKEGHVHLSAVLGQSFRVVLASMVAYWLSQSWDVFIFTKLGKLTKGKHKWLRNNLSTVGSQLLDTAIFITIAFYGRVPNIWQMIISQWLLKMICALLDTPFFYLLTRGYKFAELGGNDAREKAN